MEVFLLTRQNYNYDEFFLEMDNIFMCENESIDEFYSKIILLCYKFHLKDLPSEEDLIEWFSTLVHHVNRHNKRNDDKESIDKHNKDIDPAVNLGSIPNPIEPMNSLNFAFFMFSKFIWGISFQDNTNG